MSDKNRKDINKKLTMLWSHGYESIEIQLGQYVEKEDIDKMQKKFADYSFIE